VVTGAARGIGRAIAVEFAANGADVVAIDIAGPASLASNAVPATQAELDGTVTQMRNYGRKGEAIKADIRDIAARCARSPTRSRAGMARLISSWLMRPFTLGASFEMTLKVGWLQPDDISPAGVFLASDAANMVTAAEYEVTGGDGAENI
jgi:short chain dehydrogenase